MTIRLRHFLTKNYATFILILVDITINGLIDHQDEKIPIILMLSMQFIERLLLIFFVFTLMWDTFIVQHGLLGALCQRFKLVFIVTPISFFITIGFHTGILIGRIQGKSLLQQWDSGAVYAFYVIHNVVSMIYYATVIHSAFELADPELYKPNHWLNHINH